MSASLLHCQNIVIVAPSGEVQHAIHQDQRNNTESITNQYSTNQTTKRESENKQF